MNEQIPFYKFATILIAGALLAGCGGSHTTDNPFETGSSLPSTRMVSRSNATPTIGCYTSVSGPAIPKGERYVAATGTEECHKGLMPCVSVELYENNAPVASASQCNYYGLQTKATAIQYNCPNHGVDFYAVASGTGGTVKSGTVLLACPDRKG